MILLCYVWILLVLNPVSARPEGDWNNAKFSSTKPNIIQKLFGKFKQNDRDFALETRSIHTPVSGFSTKNISRFDNFNKYTTPSFIKNKLLSKYNFGPYQKHGIQEERPFSNLYKYRGFHNALSPITGYSRGRSQGITNNGYPMFGRGNNNNNNNNPLAFVHGRSKPFWYGHGRRNPMFRHANYGISKLTRPFSGSRSGFNFGGDVESDNSDVQNWFRNDNREMNYSPSEHYSGYNSDVIIVHPMKNNYGTSGFNELYPSMSPNFGRNAYTKQRERTDFSDFSERYPMLNAFNPLLTGQSYLGDDPYAPLSDDVSEDVDSKYATAMEPRSTSETPSDADDDDSLETKTLTPLHKMRHSNSRLHSAQSNSKTDNSYDRSADDKGTGQSSNAHSRRQGHTSSECALRFRDSLKSGTTSTRENSETTRHNNLDVRSSSDDTPAEPEATTFAESDIETEYHVQKRTEGGRPESNNLELSRIYGQGKNYGVKEFFGT